MVLKLRCSFMVTVNVLISSFLLFSTFVASAEEKPQKTPDKTAESPFQEAVSLDLQKQIDNLVSNIKEEMPIEAELKKEIKNLFVKVREGHGQFVEIDGKMERVSSIAWWKLREIGKPVIPFLVDVLTSDEAEARRDALWVLDGVILAKEQRTRIPRYVSYAKDCIPVFIRSLKDTDEEVRGIATACLSGMAMGNEDVKALLISYIAEMLEDKSQKVKIIAAEGLIRLGRKDIVPSEVLKDVGQEKY